jgi:two-component system phosphate regulon response regulator PhoB
MTIGTVLIVLEVSSYRAALEQSVRQFGCRVLATDDETLALQQTVVHLPEVVVSSAAHGEFLRRLDELILSNSLETQPFVLILPTIHTSGETGTDDGAEPGADMDSADSVARALVDLIGSDRSSVARSGQRVHCDGLRLDRARYEATLEGEALNLTLTEFNILWTLANAPERARTRQELVEASRGVGAPVQTRTIDAHIKSLRRKLGDAAQLIETVRGIGYRYASTSPSSRSTRVLGRV